MRWEIKRKLSVSTDWSASAGCRAINNSVILGHRRIIIGRGSSNPVLFVRYGSILGPRKALVYFVELIEYVIHVKNFSLIELDVYMNKIVLYRKKNWKKLNQLDRSLFHNVYCIFIYGKYYYLVLDFMWMWDRGSTWRLILVCLSFDWFLLVCKLFSSLTMTNVDLS